MTTTPAFIPFSKMARLSREVIISEKIDGTNASVCITETTNEDLDHLSWEQKKIIAIIGDLTIRAGSRTRWITPGDDNYGFAAWVNQNRDELIKLGPGRHFGEWWGSGIQRGYGLKERRFSLFNTHRWTPHDEPTYAIPNADPKAVPKFTEHPPACCHVVPVLRCGMFSTEMTESALHELRERGSLAAPGFSKPEGIVVFHVAGNVGFKKTLERDSEPKGAV